MLAFIAGLGSKTWQMILGGLGTVIALGSAVLWVFMRGKESERLKNLEDLAKADAAHDGRIADAIEARNESLAKDTKIAAGNGGSMDSGHDDNIVQLDPYKNDPYRRD